MSSSEECLNKILSMLPSEGISYRRMMGEYIIYYSGKVVGGIYDDRFLVKVTKSSEAILPDAPRELPYEGAKPMILVEDVQPTVVKDIVVSIWVDLYGKK
ncbi:MAG: TfoX/Sxy family protein, partial [Candidatus Methanomethylophilaceae archaeon]|nr:TfoX/Sxy family protein [Candidatus Methanomethylophilaceae archaeon]